MTDLQGVTIEADPRTLMIRRSLTPPVAYLAKADAALLGLEPGSYRCRLTLLFNGGELDQQVQTLMWVHPLNHSTDGTIVPPEIAVSFGSLAADAQFDRLRISAIVREGRELEE